ncbi:DUF4143 domain-containing protein [Mesorhizobium sp. NBSH29]|uniref:DUF4143 domain-containing protein n=1 Tax=Mesorhizobium sp. NBSH29 TaxID=2654249 RepID=UPI0035BC0B7F
MLAHSSIWPAQCRRLCSRARVWMARTVASYLDLMVDLLLVRRLEPWHSNAGEAPGEIAARFMSVTPACFTLCWVSRRLMMSWGIPSRGASWEGFVVETVHAVIPQGARTNFYRTAAGAEIDLVVTLPGGRDGRLRSRRSISPKARAGLPPCMPGYCAGSTHRLSMPGNEAFPLGQRYSGRSSAQTRRTARRRAPHDARGGTCRDIMISSTTITGHVDPVDMSTWTQHRTGPA